MVIDVPSGRVTARVHTTADRVTGVEFVNVPGYLLHRDLPVGTSRGSVTADVSFGGAIYAQVDARSVGLEVTPENVTELIALGREVKAALTGTRYARHPSDDRLSGIYGTIFFTDDGTDTDGNPCQRNVTIFADGQVDRSPCGSGTGARVATLVARGVLRDGHRLVHRSIVDSVFYAEVAGTCRSDGHDAVVPVVLGTAYRTAEHRFTADPDDELVPGFVLR